MKTVAILALILLLASCARAQTARFAIEGDAGVSCFSVQPGGETVQFQVVAYYSGLSDPGGGFEFRITGVPSGWAVSATPNSFSNVTIGDPFGDGVNIAFPICEPGEGDRVVLYDVIVSPTTEEVADLAVAAHATPSNANVACPLMPTCIAFSAICFPTGQVGSIRGDGSLCTVGVEVGSWAAAKRLFR